MWRKSVSCYSRYFATNCGQQRTAPIPLSRLDMLAQGRQTRAEVFRGGPKLRQSEECKPECGHKCGCSSIRERKQQRVLHLVLEAAGCYFAQNDQ